MMEARTVVVRHFKTAEEIWSHLMDPNHYPSRTAWAFRGQANAEWKLLPSAHRDGAFAEFLTHEELAARTTLFEQEIFMLRKFAFAANDAGLNVTSAALRMLDASQLTTVRSDGSWPSDELEEVLALAQHSRVPTRLLDWTKSPSTAAYFAAREAMLWPDNKTRPGMAAVWALNVPEAMGVQRHPRFRRLSPAKASNPNLFAQGGLFSLVNLPHDAEPVALCDWATTNEHASHGLLEKLTFPIVEAPRLFHIVTTVAHVTARSLYPGYSGVVESLREGAVCKRLLGP